ncbi:hypothetical protein V0288_22385 [Pannus brasiliensis CCIBt3594]|uniref:Uncharacterized protein n=1 Tax=Pannus brasiliensis CCIBt3594 TaxID=1427578 RepID=A0AAW9QQ33_9CHRO
MKYRTVSYGYVKNSGNYENERIFLEAELEEGESYETVLEQLKKEVHTSLNDFEDYYKREREMRQLKNEIAELIEKREEARNLYEATRSFLETQGLKTDMPPFPQHKGYLTPAIEAENVDDLCF